MQKRALRTICNSHFREHTSPLFKYCKFLKFVDLVNTSILVTMFKVINHLLPANIQHFFERNISCPYKTRSYGKFTIRYVRTNLKYMSVSMIGVRLWNNLQPSLTNITSLNKFKSEVKKSIYEQYF